MEMASAAATYDKNVSVHHLIWLIENMSPTVFRTKQFKFRPWNESPVSCFLDFKSDTRSALLERPIYELSLSDVDFADGKDPYGFLLSVQLVDREKILFSGEQHHVPPQQGRHQSMRFVLSYIPQTITVFATVKVYRKIDDNPTLLSELTAPLFGSHMLSDMTLVCGDVEFPCHKVLLACRSEFFKTMFTEQFNEASEKRVTIGGVRPDILELLLRFIYTDKLDASDISWDLFEAAKTYGVARLDRLCSSSLRQSLDINNCCGMLEASFAHDLDELFNVALDFMRRNKEQVVGTDEFNRIMSNTGLKTKMILVLL